MRLQSSYYGYEGCHRSATVTAQTSHHEHPMFSKMIFGVYLLRLVPIPHPIYVLSDSPFR